MYLSELRYVISFIKLIIERDIEPGPVATTSIAVGHRRKKTKKKNINLVIYNIIFYLIWLVLDNILPYSVSILDLYFFC